MLRESLTGEFAMQVAVTLAVAAGSYLIGRLSERVRSAKTYGHLRALLRRASEAQIILPSFAQPSLPIEYLKTESEFPPNVLLMPMAESVAVTRLSALIHRSAPRLSVRISDDVGHLAPRSVMFCVGGPSVNRVSRTVLAREFPMFRLAYPEHEAFLDGRPFVPQRADDGSLIEDYGFIFISHRAAHTTVVLCGVWPMGSEMATATLLEMGEDRRLGDLLRKPSKAIIVVRGAVDGVLAGSAEILEVRDFGAPGTSPSR